MALFLQPPVRTIMSVYCQPSIGTRSITNMPPFCYRELLIPNSSVALHRHSHSVVDLLPPEADSSIQLMQVSEKPDVTYAVTYFYHD